MARSRMTGREKLESNLQKVNTKIAELEEKLAAAKSEKKEIEAQINADKLNAVMKLMEAKGMSVDDLENLVSGQ